MNTLNLGDVDSHPFVVLFGTPDEGFIVVGPFNSYDDAKKYLETDPDGKTNAWVVAMDQPAEKDEP